MSYRELKERFNVLQDCALSQNPYEKLADLAEDMLVELHSLERSLYLLKRGVPPEISCYYPKITKDPTIHCFKGSRLVDTQSLQNPDFTNLYKLGLYALSEEGTYLIRTIEQLGYISKFLEGQIRKVVGLEDYYFYITFD